ncbi:hypothetical protein INS49_004447 [Diaporthe citri]|uniref:uncharacterized protein n=1 Tax=Diaporthe citri TaxID=83186 RepID=UPI001C7FDDDF|nr:uncharacterized protein INS49_004447 [Diaporthe citri]KAG6354430.1 hypothetical protein INS49_004447 [Diaporthe citri]
MASFPNVYTHRKVAEAASKRCEICFKPSTSVLVTPDKQLPVPPAPEHGALMNSRQERIPDSPSQQDFFFVCPSHLKDRGFCSPIVDQAAIDAKKKKDMEAEVEKVKKEYEERQRKKKEDSEKSKDKDKEKDKEKDGDDKKTDDDKADESKAEQKAEEEEPAEEEPRVFALHRTFHQNRVYQKRQAEMAKRNRERIQNPNFFPSVPKGNP